MKSHRVATSESEKSLSLGESAVNGSFSRPARFFLEPLKLPKRQRESGPTVGLYDHF